jgi:hypothetical protein
VQCSALHAGACGSEFATSANGRRRAGRAASPRTVVRASPLRDRIACMNEIAPTLAEFARPILQPLADDTPLTRRREALGLAVMVWNAVVLDRKGGDHVATILEQLAQVPEPGGSMLTRLAEELVARKRERYPDDLRVVVRWELTEVAPGQLSLEVEAGPATNVHS